MQRNPLNGRPEPEVIVNFVGGLSYNKGKMEDAIFSGELFPPKPAVKAKDIYHTFSGTRTRDTSSTSRTCTWRNEGDLEKALLDLISPGHKSGDAR
ncbi:hypothetical protein ACEPAI_3456 [Sanghuangporus weigelae]